jgi:hypothetical protein
MHANIEECTDHHHPLLHGSPRLSVLFKDKAKTPKEEISETSENKKQPKRALVRTPLKEIQPLLCSLPFQSSLMLMEFESTQ